MSNMSVDKKFTSPVIQDAKLIEISNAIHIYKVRPKICKTTVIKHR